MAFGPFEVRAASGELRKHGIRIRLQRQPFQILVILLRHPGEVVTREQLRDQLWSDGTFVDFEHGLNAAINRLREALSDDADKPRFIETLPRLGYRFIAPVLALSPTATVAAEPSQDTPRELPAPANSATAPPQAAYASRWWPAAVGVLAVVALAVSAVHFRETPLPEPATVRFQIPLPDKVSFNRCLAISPDGRHLAFAAIGQDGRSLLWVRALDSQEARPLPGTDNALLLFWSPDSRFIGYHADGKLRKVEASGGPPQTLCDTGQAAGTWNRDGIILFGKVPAPGGLYRVSAAGGVPVSITKPDLTRRETAQSFPVFLPDGKHFLYLAGSTDFEGGAIYLAELDSKLEVKDQRRLSGSQYAPAYAPGKDGEKGYLLFFRETTLMAQAFDGKRLELAGEAFPAAEQVGSYRNSGFFGFSSNRTLVYRTSGGGPKLQWFDREGKSLGVVGPAGGTSSPALSSDGKQVAVDRTDSQAGGNHDIWLLDQASGTTLRFTFHPAPETSPVWSPDGVWVAFATERDGPANIYRKRANNEGAEEALLKSSVALLRPTDWSRDGRFLLYTAIDPKTGAISGCCRWTGTGSQGLICRVRSTKLRDSFRRTAAGWPTPRTSRAGRKSMCSPFPPRAASGRSRRLVVCNRGGAEMGRSCSILLGRTENLMAVEVKTGAKSEAGIPRALFKLRVLPSMIITRYTPAADGKRFLISTAGDEESDSAPFHVVLNWKPGRP